MVLSVALCSMLVPSVHWGRQGSGHGGDFALHEAVRGRVVGVSDPHVVQIPPFGDGEITV